MFYFLRRNLGWGTCDATETPAENKTAQFLRGTSSREQKKVFMKSIEGSIEKQKEVIREAEMTPS
tara:strand:+ start:1756 stop:1950 length:195 start_codon:yes stop_codon:yes gene_type:complete